MILYILIIETIVVAVNSVQNAIVTVQFETQPYSVYSHAKQRKKQQMLNFRSSIILTVHVSLLTTSPLKSILKHFFVILSGDIVIQM